MYRVSCKYVRVCTRCRIIYERGMTYDYYVDHNCLLNFIQDPGESVVVRNSSAIPSISIVGVVSNRYEHYPEYFKVSHWSSCSKRETERGGGWKERDRAMRTSHLSIDLFHRLFPCSSSLSTSPLSPGPYQRAIGHISVSFSSYARLSSNTSCSAVP